MRQLHFEELLVSNDGMIRGPFGGDIKKSMFVKRGPNTCKVYTQSVIYDKNPFVGEYFLPRDYCESKLKRFFVKRGDVLISGAGTLGDTYILPENHPLGIINQALIRIRLDKTVIDSNFFTYYFRCSIKQIANRLNGNSVIPNMPPLNTLKQIEISIPSITEQLRITNT